HVAHGPTQRVTQEGALIHHGLTFKVPRLRKCDRLLRTDARRVRFDPVLTDLGGSDHRARLIAILLREFAMASLHLVASVVPFGSRGAVRRDLRGARAASVGVGEMRFNLLTAWAGRLEVLLAVSANLRLST